MPITTNIDVVTVIVLLRFSAIGHPLYVSDKSIEKTKSLFKISKRAEKNKYKCLAELQSK